MILEKQQEIIIDLFALLEIKICIKIYIRTLKRGKMKIY